MSHWIIGKIELVEYNSNNKSDVAVQTVIDLNIEEVQQNTEPTQENLEQEHSQVYIQTNFESDESCSSEEDKIIIDFKALF